MHRRGLRIKVTDKVSIPQIPFFRARGFPHRGIDLKINGYKPLLGVLVLAAVFAVHATAETMQQADSSSAPQSAVPTGTQTAVLPAQADNQGSAPLRVMVGKSLLINTTQRLKR